MRDSASVEACFILLLHLDLACNSDFRLFHLGISLNSVVWKSKRAVYDMIFANLEHICSGAWYVLIH